MRWRLIAEFLEEFKWEPAGERIALLIAAPTDSRDERWDVFLAAGGNGVLAYDGRRSTRDIDALVVPHGVVLDGARTVADELNLPRWWLNEQASAYVAAGGNPEALCADVFPAEPVPDRARRIVEELFSPEA